MNSSIALADVLVDELIRGGVRDAVLSPGSRNAPLAFAMHRADKAGRLRLHVRIDERSAGFLAHGMAMYPSSPPVAVACTSGTAAVNLHPAAVEADAAGVPLVLLTADRPSELRGTGANQTIDQQGLFGKTTRYAAELATADGTSAELNAYWRATVCRALDAARHGPDGRGPVHLNIAFRPPLVPDGDHATKGRPESLDGRANGAAWTTTRMRRAGPADGQMRIAPRTLIMVGSAAPDLALAADLTAAELGLPLITEAGRGWLCKNALNAGSLLLNAEEFLDKHAPEQVLVVGRPTLGRGLSSLVRRPGVALTVVDDNPRWADPDHQARQVYEAASLVPGVIDHVADAGWADVWRRADAAVTLARDAFVTATWPSGPALARAMVAQLPRESLLFLGASSPVRDVDLAASRRSDLTILANRGASGIDGSTSSAIGAALGFQTSARRNAYALMGDLAFLHDANGLLIGPDEPRPDLTIVVANNNGGGLFGLLEQGAPEFKDVFERVFAAPHRARLGSLCAALGAAYQRVTDPGSLRQALSPARGIQVVEVPMSRAEDRSRMIQLRRAVRDTLVQVGLALA